ncbi:MAG: hypothetical protein AAGM21_00925 [Pseudomonadota bacterium]
MRRFFRITGYVLGALLAVNVAFVGMISFPGWAFAHVAGTERIRIHSPHPLPPETAVFAARIMADLDASALPPPDKTTHIYITGSGWRETLFFAAAPRAGGLVYAIGPGNIVFLSGADIAANRLIKDGVVINPPRTLAYYITHEIAHVSQLARYGLVDYLRLPQAIREGIADYLALGPADGALRDAIVDTMVEGPHFDLMEAHGAYPKHRVFVSDLIADGDVVALMDQTLGKRLPAR